MRQRIFGIVAALSLLVCTTTAQTISFSDFEARPGRNVVVDFSISGTNEMIALQFNLSLPEGFSLFEYDEGENLTVGGVKTGHEMKVVPLENGDYLIVLYNMYLNTFNETLSFSMTLKASEDSGIKEGRIYNVRMSTVDAVSHICEGVSFKAAVGKPINGITLDQTAATLTEGETLTLTATVSPDDATDKTVTWSTSDASVATVADGVVTAVAAGTATITAKAGEHSATCVVTVTRKEEPFTGITAISELSNTVLYAVSQPNHSKGATSWAVQEGGQALKSSYDLGLSVDGEDARQQFAFVSNDGGTTLYLYHAAEAKFVAKDGSLGSKPVDAIQFKAGAYDNTFVAYFDDAHYINVGGGSQMIIDSWNIADGGNSCVIVPVGEFDPTEALKAFESEDTGIENPEFNNQKSELIYDLTGRRVEKATKGIYIVNGKKVVIR